MDYLSIVDKLISAIMALNNLVGVSQKVSGIIAKRITENREWTDEERKIISDDLAANKAYAALELSKPDVT